MAEDLKTKVEIGGDTAGLTAAFSEAARILKEQAASMVESLKGVRESVENLTGLFQRLQGGILAAAGLDEFNKLMTESETSTRSFALALGTTPEKASVLKSALNTIGASSDTYVGALDHLARQLKANEDGINALGIATRNADGSTRDSQAVMLDALRAVQQYKPGLDQTQAAMYLFGRSVQDVRTLMPLLNQNMAEAKEKAEALGLVLSDQQVAAVNKYKVALNESKEVVEGAFNAIGTKLIPVLTEAAEGFAKAGPAIVAVASAMGDVLAAALRTVGDLFSGVAGFAKEAWAIISDGISQVTALFQGGAIDTVHSWAEEWHNVLGILSAVADFLKGSVLIAIESVVGGVKNLATIFVTAGTAIADVAHGDFTQAWNDIKAGVKSVGDNTAATLSQMVATARATGTAMGKALSDGYRESAPKPADLTDPLKIDQTGKKAFQDPNKLKDDLAGRDAVLQAQLAGEVAIVKEWAKEQNNELSRGYKDGIVSLQDYYSHRRAVALAEIDTEINAAEQLEKANAVRKKSAADSGAEKDVQAALAEEIKLQDQLIVLRQRRAAEAKESSAEEADAEREAANKIADIQIAAREKAGTAALEAQKTLIESEQRLGQISNADAIEAYKRLEDQRYTIAVQAAKDRAALLEQTPLEQAKIDAQLEELEAEHQKKLTELTLQATKERQDLEEKVVQSLEGDFQQFFENIEKGQQTVKKDFQDLFNSILSQIEKIASQQLTDSLFSALGLSAKPGGAGGGGGGLFGSAFSAIGGLLGLGGGAGGAATGSAEAVDALSIAALASGTPFVPQTGIYQLHQGERVLTRDENLNYSGNTTHVTNNFNVSGETTYESRQAMASQTVRALRAAQRNG